MHFYDIAGTRLKSMQNILLISTGGTIACEPGADGLAPKLDGAALAGMVSALAEMCRISVEELFSLDSSNIQPHHWSEIADIIGCNYEKYDGFVVTHGTDTMAYTAAALSCMLKNLDKPVVITGSQLPMEHPETDGKRNVLHAFEAACSGRRGVFLVFGDKVIDGRRAKKMHTREFDAFYSINEPYAAEISNGGVTWNVEASSAHAGEFTVMPKIDNAVLPLKLIPGMKPEILDYAVSNRYRGIVIEGFGAGGVPNGENDFMPALERALKAGVVVVCATQCIYDGVILTEYPMGVIAARLGAISAGKMTSEYAAVRLMWALGNSSSADEAKKLFTEGR